MKLTPSKIACLSLLVYWGPSNGLTYLWSFILLIFLGLFKPEWLVPRNIYQRNIWICTTLFLVIGLLSFLINLQPQKSSVNNLIWTFITYGSSLAGLHIFVNLPYRDEDFKTVFQFTIGLTLFQIALGYFQMLWASSFQTFNPFTLSAGAGDSFVGTTFDEGIGNQVAVKVSLVALLFFPYWIRHKGLKNTMILVLLVMGWLLPSAIYTLFIGLMVIFLYYFIEKIIFAINTLRLSIKIFIAVTVGTLSIVAFMLLQPSNISYVKVLIDRGYRTLFDENVPNPIGKIVYYKETFTSLLKDYPQTIIIGVGPGNYSSRSAWMVSGAYLMNQPSYIPVTPSKVALDYTLTFWRKEFITKDFPDASSITYQPFSSWVSVFSEFGIFGLMVFMSIFFFLNKKINKARSSIENSGLNDFVLGTKMVTTYILLLFFFDNLFEWPLVMGQFFIMIGLLKKNSS